MEQQPDFATIEAAARTAAESEFSPIKPPTEKQKAAGNYKTGRVTIHGFNIAIENPRGSYRHGTDANGKKWSSRINDHYGYIVSIGNTKFNQMFPQSAIADANDAGYFLKSESITSKVNNGFDVISVLVPHVITNNSSLFKNLSKRAFGNIESFGYLGSANAFIDEINGIINIPSERVNSLNIDTLLDQARSYYRSAYAYIFGDSVHGESVLSHGYDSLDINIKSFVKSNVITGIENDKIFNGIVGFLLVDMMDMFFSSKLSSESRRNYKTMLLDRLTRSFEFDNPVFIGWFIDLIATRLPVTLATWVAEEILTSFVAPTISNKGGVAIGASHSVSGHGVEKYSKRKKGIIGADGDPVDCFIGTFMAADRAYVINQFVNGRFDETKIMMCFADEAQAKLSYQLSFDRGWDGLSSIVEVTYEQLKWWLKNGDMSRPLIEKNLPFKDLESVTMKPVWQEDTLTNSTIDRLLYDLRRTSDGLMFDSVTLQDIYDDADGRLAFDALVIPYQTLERKMKVVERMLNHSGQNISVAATQISEPFKQYGVTNVAVVFELSDGQTVSIFFHNPDVDPRKLNQTDELISWKWLLNKKDITVVVAPELGKDLNIQTVAKRVMALANKSSAAFAKTNTNRAQRLERIQGLRDEIATLETELTQVQHELEVAKVEAESKSAVEIPPITETTDPAPTETQEETNNYPPREPKENSVFFEESPFVHGLATYSDVMPENIRTWLDGAMRRALDKVRSLGLPEKFNDQIERFENNIGNYVSLNDQVVDDNGDMLWFMIGEDLKRDAPEPVDRLVATYVEVVARVQSVNNETNEQTSTTETTTPEETAGTEIENWHVEVRKSLGLMGWDGFESGDAMTATKNGVKFKIVTPDEATDSSLFDMFYDDGNTWVNVDTVSYKEGVSAYSVATNLDKNAVFYSENMEKTEDRYQFGNATEEFKDWAYSNAAVLATAKRMDDAAAANGAHIEWGFFNGFALDSAMSPPSTQAEDMSLETENIDTNNVALDSVDGVGLATHGEATENENGETVEKPETIALDGAFDLKGIRIPEKAIERIVNDGDFDIEMHSSLKGEIKSTKTKQSVGMLTKSGSMASIIILHTEKPNPLRAWLATNDFLTEDEAVEALSVDEKFVFDDASSNPKYQVQCVKLAKAYNDSLKGRSTKEAYAKIKESLDMVDAESAKRIEKTVDKSGLNVPPSAFYAMDSIVDDENTDPYVGKIIKGGNFVGRVDFGEDGKAMVYVGASGDQRVQYNGRDVYYSDNDAPLMVDWLFAMLPDDNAGTGTVDPEPAPTGETLPLDYRGYRIYKSTVGGKEYVAVDVGRGGPGDTLHASIEEAKKEIDFMMRQEEDRIKREENAKLEQEKEAQETAKRNDLDGFESTLTPLQRGKAVEALNKVFKTSDGVLSLKSFIKKRIEDGFKPEIIEEKRIKDPTRTAWNRMDDRQQRDFEKRQKEGGMVPKYYLTNDDGVMSEINKTGYDYAQYLLSQKTVEEPVPIEETTPEPVIEPEPEAPAADPIRTEIDAEIESLRSETDIITFDRRLDDLAAKVEAAGLMEEYEPKLNDVADVLTFLLAEAEKAA